MRDRQRILTTAALVMVCLAVAVSATALAVLYRSALAERRLDLQAFARHEARLIEAVAGFDAVNSQNDNPAGARGATLSLIADAQQRLAATDETREVTIAYRDGDHIVFLSHRRDDGRCLRVPWVSDWAEPMRRALMGQSGTVEAPDYRGELVLAAYEPISILNLGFVAKTDMAELRAPFASAAKTSIMIAVLAILVGLIVLRNRLKPLIQHSQDSEDQALKALAALRSQKQAMDEHSIVTITDPLGTITYANDRFCRTSQYSREELVGRDHRIVSSGHHSPDFWAEAWKTIAAREVWQGEVCNRAKDGSLYWMGTTIVPFKDEAGQITQYVCIQTDITERKRAEAKLIHAKEAAESANIAKSEFLANMSHEIRTPMTAILGFADQLLEEGEIEKAPPERIDAINTIRKNGKCLLDLINDILDLSKIEAGKLTIERRGCQPYGVVAEVASLMRVRAYAKGLAFNVEYIGAIPETIQSDPARLRQILINLIGNAIKFTETGAVRLLTRFVDGDEPYLQFDVMDTGCGMTEEQTGTLFQPFTQADNATTRKFGGTGLGLTISKRLAELLGGDIIVAETEMGVGTTFRTTVSTGPLDGVAMLDDYVLATVATDTASAVARITPSDLQGCRILLVEDCPDNQRLVSFVLKKAGADVSVEENGKLALDTALAARDSGHPFDVILMDMQMPVMDGYEATSQLRRKGYTAPIIALTAHAMKGDRDKCIRAGCDDYATKPVDRKKLVATIRQWRRKRTTPEEDQASGTAAHETAGKSAEKGFSPQHSDRPADHAGMFTP